MHSRLKLELVQGFKLKNQYECLKNNILILWHLSFTSKKLKIWIKSILSFQTLIHLNSFHNKKPPHVCITNLQLTASHFALFVANSSKTLCRAKNILTTSWNNSNGFKLLNWIKSTNALFTSLRKFHFCAKNHQS